MGLEYDRKVLLRLVDLDAVHSVWDDCRASDVPRAALESAFLSELAAPGLDRHFPPLKSTWGQDQA